MDNTALICILYNPSEECLQYWGAVAAGGACCIFVDNSSMPMDKSALLDKAIYLQLGENKGIATAQNIGIAKARELGMEFVVFFDQDSRFDLSLVETLKTEFINIRNNGVKIGAIGPLIMDSERGELYKGNVAASEEPQKVDTLISSGTLTSLEVLNEVGGMADKMFIDGVDHEWCWRVQSFGYQNYKSGRAILPHKVGSKTVKLFGLPFLISAPFRYYYQYRNFCWICKLDYAPSSRKYKGFMRKAVELFFVPWYTTQPFQTIKNMIKGVCAGIKDEL